MKALQRKLLRDLWKMRGQMVAIVAVVACGVAAFVTMLANHDTLERSMHRYYEDQRFADVFARLVRAPDPVADRIGELPGVAEIVPRVAMSANVEVPGFAEPITGHLMGIDGNEGLNRLYLRRGRMLEPGRDDEVLVNEPFADVHELAPGDALVLVLNGRRQRFRVAGVVLSPEHVYQIAGGTTFPDEKRFGVLWADRVVLEAALDMEGAFNDLAIRLAAGADEDRVVEQLDRILAPYGGLGAHGRDLQLSHRYLSMELQQLESSGVITPAIFLGVAAFLVNVVLTRLIRTQREQVAALKAVGYSNLQVGWHYSQMVIGVVVLGTAIGTGLGAYLGRGMSDLYARFFRFPEMDYGVEPRVVTLALAISLGSALIGAFRSVTGAVRLPPAEAMRPPAPPTHRRTLLERAGLGLLLGPAARMVLRNVSRRPVRTFLGTFGIALSVAILVVGNFSRDALTYLMHVQFVLTQRETVTITFHERRPAHALHEVEHLPSVLYAEPIRSVPVELVSGHRSHRTSILGLPPGSDLRKLLDPELRTQQIPSDGLLLTDYLGEKLRVRPGDEVEVEVLEGSRARIRMPVVGLVEELIGATGYMDLGALGRRLGDGDLVSGALVTADTGQLDQLFAAVRDIPAIATVTRKDAALESFEESSAEMQGTMSLILVGFASVIAIGVVYNSARIALSERSRELASLRVLGATRAEVSAILLGELGVQLVLALPLGCVLGYGLAWGLIGSMGGGGEELYRIPIVIYPRTYALAVLYVLGAGIVTGLLVRRKIDHLDLISVLKVRE